MKDLCASLRSMYQCLSRRAFLETFHGAGLASSGGSGGFVIAQIAPSIRAAIGELNLQPGTAMTGQDRDSPAAAGIRPGV